MMRVRIVQCLCPARHALLAIVGMDPEQTDAELLQLVRTAVEMVLAGEGLALGLPQRTNPWCGICGAGVASWVYELGWSREFRDEAEALRVLKASEANQHMTAALLNLLDLTYDARLRHGTKH
jgi:hypothetical protein